MLTSVILKYGGNLCLQQKYLNEVADGVKNSNNKLVWPHLLTALTLKCGSNLCLKQ